LHLFGGGLVAGSCVEVSKYYTVSAKHAKWRALKGHKQLKALVLCAGRTWNGKNPLKNGFMYTTELRCIGLEK
jgi:hypothetical protein